MIERISEPPKRLADKLGGPSLIRVRPGKGLNGITKLPQGFESHLRSAARNGVPDVKDAFDIARTYRYYPCHKRASTKRTWAPYGTLSTSESCSFHALLKSATLREASLSGGEKACKSRNLAEREARFYA